VIASNGCVNGVSWTRMRAWRRRLRRMCDCFQWMCQRCFLDSDEGVEEEIAEDV
jgi:hypothetical protein